MFFIFNKDKVMSYIVTVFTVGILFFTASVFSNNKETVQTSANESKNSQTDFNENIHINESNNMVNNNN